MYTSELDNGVGGGIYYRKLDLYIALRLPYYCSVFYMDLLAIYRAAQWVVVSSAPFFPASLSFRQSGR